MPSSLVAEEIHLACRRIFESSRLQHFGAQRFHEGCVIAGQVEMAITVPGIGRALRIKVSDDPKKAIRAAKPDVVVLCTNSSLRKVMPQMEAILKLKVPIVSTTEELAYPTTSNSRPGCWHERPSPS